MFHFFWSIWAVEFFVERLDPVAGDRRPLAEPVGQHRRGAAAVIDSTRSLRPGPDLAVILTAAGGIAVESLFPVPGWLP